MTRSLILVLLSGLGIVMAGCGGDNATLPDYSEGSGPGSTASAGGADGATTTGTGGGGGLEVFREIPGEGEGPLSRLVIYFEFNQSDIRAEFNAMVTAHGEYLASNAGASVRLEGHADERGSREYNIGLGERRAQAVRRLLLLQGAAGGQLGTVSYGEERPAIVGSDEEAWGLNRRVELVYR